MERGEPVRIGQPLQIHRPLPPRRHRGWDEPERQRARIDRGRTRPDADFARGRSGVERDPHVRRPGRDASRLQEGGEGDVQRIGPAQLRRVLQREQWRESVDDLAQRHALDPLHAPSDQRRIRRVGADHGQAVRELVQRDREPAQSTALHGERIEQRVPVLQRREQRLQLHDDPVVVERGHVGADATCPLGELGRERRAAEAPVPRAHDGDERVDVGAPARDACGIGTRRAGHRCAPGFRARLTLK